MSSIYLERLERATAADRHALLSDPAVARLLRGEATRHEYAYFLWQSHYHMQAAVRAFAAGAARLDDAHSDLARHYVHHAQDEWGEDRWCLNDLKALGMRDGPREAQPPSAACAAFVAYLFYLAEHGNPVALLADSYVVEGLAASSAGALTDHLKRNLNLPPDALTYLERHAAIDGKHFGEFAQLLDRAIQSEEDWQALVQAARTLFWIFAEFVRDVARAGECAGARIMAAALEAA